MNRRRFLSLAPLLPAALRAAAATPPMKVVKVETIYWPGGQASASFWPHWTWVRLTTDSGLKRCIGVLRTEGVFR